jgi:RecA-family ATPase
VNEPFIDFEATPPQTNGRAYGDARAAPTLVERLRDRLVRVEPRWITDKPPPLDYLVRDSRTGCGAIEAEGTGLLVAAGASGKGFTSLSLGLAVSTGTPWLGCMTVERCGRVLFVSAEDGAKTHLRYRIHAMARAMGIKELGENFDILDVRDLHVPMLTPEGVPGGGTEALAEIVREGGPYALVVLDPVSRVAGASIDADNVAATALLGCFEAVSAASGGFVMGCHHTSLDARKKKDTSTTGIRGATGLGDSARSVMTLSVDRLALGDSDLNAHLGELVTVRLTKANHVRQWEPIIMRRCADGALAPLDASDRERIDQARKKADPAPAKRATREVERDATRAARAAKEAAAKAAREAADEAARRRQDNEDDAAACRLRTEHPEAAERIIFAMLKKDRACGSGRAQAAVVRTRPASPAHKGEGQP